MADGLDAVAAEAFRLWPRARTDGLVSGEWGSARAAAFAGAVDPYRRAASPAEQRQLADRLVRSSLGRLMRLHLLHLESFAAAVNGIWQRATAAGWPVDRYVEAVLALATTWSVGAVADTWILSAVVIPYFDAGTRQALKPQAFGPVFPYFERDTRLEEDRSDPAPPEGVSPGEVRVRPNHLALHGFVASTSWSGWASEIVLPLGWRCRCRDRRVSFLEAQERRLSGEFPAGTAKLEEFRALGGPDAGFPREVFVSTL